VPGKRDTGAGTLLTQPTARTSSITELLSRDIQVPIRERQWRD
jgi:hypothetical protein